MVGALYGSEYCLKIDCSIYPYANIMNAENSPIKILHVTYHMGIGGTEQVIFQLVNNADELLFENSIVCLEGEIGPIGQQLQESGTRFHILSRDPGFDINLIKSVRKIITTENIDVVHCHQYTPYVYGVLASLLTGSRVIFTEHGRFHPDRYSWKRRMINPVLGLATSSITAISEATKEALANFEWFSRKSIKVIYNGIKATVPPTEHRNQNKLGLTDQNIVFGTITRFDTIKNLPMMINAFAQVFKNNPHTRLLLVGDGDQRPAMEKLVSELELNNAVVFTGFQTDTAKYMSLIDVYVLSSFSEGTSMTLLEAMSFSTCCIVTAVGGNVEIIVHQQNGYIVESDNTLQLAETMQRLADDDKARHQMGAEAKKTFDQKFDLNQMVQKYKEIYLDMAC